MDGEVGPMPDGPGLTDGGDVPPPDDTGDEGINFS